MDPSSGDTLLWDVSAFLPPLLSSLACWKKRELTYFYYLRPCLVPADDDGTSRFPAQAFAAWANADRPPSANLGLLPLPLPPPSNRQPALDHVQSSHAPSSSYYTQILDRSFDADHPNMHQPSSSFYSPPPPSRLSAPPLGGHDDNSSYSTCGPGLVARPATSSSE